MTKRTEISCLNLLLKSPFIKTNSCPNLDHFASSNVNVSKLVN